VLQEQLEKECLNRRHRNLTLNLNLDRAGRGKSRENRI